MSEVKMGLGGSPDPIYLHVSESIDGEGEVHGWHLWDGKKSIPVKERSLTGILSSIRVKLGPEFSGKRPVKLQLRLETGDQPYIVQSGADTIFARGALLALDMVEDLAKPLKLAVANGDKKVVFARLHRVPGDERVQVMWDKERKLFPLVQKLQGKLGQRPQTWEDVQATARNEQENGNRPEEQPEDSPF